MFMLLSFIAGLVVGLIALIVDRRRYDTKLKRVLGRLEDREVVPKLSYDAQIASAIAQQQVQIERLNKQIKDLRHLLQNAPVGYLQVDEESRLLWCNQRAQEFLDIDQGDYTQPRLLLATVRSYELDQLIERTRENQSSSEACWTFNAISTDPVNYLERPAYPLQGYGFPLAAGQVGVFLENKQEAVVLSQQRDRWISDVAHELKTPLTSIRLVAETLQSRVTPNLLSWVERLLKEVIRLSLLVDDVLKMSSLEQRQTQWQEYVDTDLVPLIQAAWQGVEPLAKLKQVTLNYRGPERLIATVNASLIHALVFNLLSNAVKYSPSEEIIRVRLSLTESSQAKAPTRLLPAHLSSNHLLLEVIDTGSGLSDKDLPHIFDRFYRADPARSREAGLDSSELKLSYEADAAKLSSQGTGLGLAIVRQIAEVHRGRVEAKNHPKYGGAWLRVWLPCDRLKGRM